MIDFERERARLAGEAHNAGYVVHRLVNFARIMGEAGPPGWSLEAIDDMAAALQDWAVEVSSRLVDQTLAEDLAARTRRQRHWRARHQELQRQAPKSR